MVVDAHTHVASGGADVDDGTWWGDGASIADLLSALDDGDVDRAVIVQAIGAHGYDCAYAVESATDNRDRCSLVIAVDMHEQHPAVVLESMIDAYGDEVPLRGIRLFGVDGRHPVWLTDGRAAAVCDLAADLELTIVPTLFSDQFDGLRDLVRRFPSVPFALDHCGFLDMGDDRSEARLLELSDLDNLHLKVTSYVLTAAERDEGDPAPIVERLAEKFGTRRLCWGSDHPQDRRHAYGDKLALAVRSTRAFDESARAAFFNDTARTLFF